MKYDADGKWDVREWSSLSEEEQLNLVVDYHRREDIELPDERVHAVFHVIVERQVSLGDEFPAAAKLEDLLREGLDRHDAIHAIGSVLAEHIYDLLTMDSDESDPSPRYLEALERLTAESWNAKSTD
jgi:hypothetical protein